MNYQLKKHKRQVHSQITNDFTDENNDTSNDKPFSCSVCNKRFTLKSNFKMHKIQIHNDKPYICNICNGARFNLNSRLKRHKRQVHSQITNDSNEENSAVKPEIISGDLNEGENAILSDKVQIENQHNSEALRDVISKTGQILA